MTKAKSLVSETEPKRKPLAHIQVGPVLERKAPHMSKEL
jgi:hypothetical protein